MNTKTLSIVSVNEAAVYEDVENSLEGNMHDSRLDLSPSGHGSVSRFSLVLSEAMDDPVTQLCDAVREKTTSSQ